MTTPRHPSGECGDKKCWCHIGPLEYGAGHKLCSVEPRPAYRGRADAERHRHKGGAAMTDAELAAIEGQARLMLSVGFDERAQALIDLLAEVRRLRRMQNDDGGPAAGPATEVR